MPPSQSSSSSPPSNGSWMGERTFMALVLIWTPCLTAKSWACQWKTARTEKQVMICRSVSRMPRTCEMDHKCTVPYLSPPVFDELYPHCNDVRKESKPSSKVDSTNDRRCENRKNQISNRCMSSRTTPVTCDTLSIHSRPHLSLGPSLLRAIFDGGCSSPSFS